MEPIRRFSQLLEVAQGRGPVTLAVAGGESAIAIATAYLAERAGLARAILVGDAGRIEAALAVTKERPRKAEIHPAEEDVAAEAVRICLSGQAQFVMKGAVKSDELLHAVLRTEEDEIKRQGYFLSHIAIIENPKAGKLLAVTDGGMNVAPDLDVKVRIMENAIQVMRRLGIRQPKVLLAAGMEDTGQDIPAIVDAREIVKRHRAGEWEYANIDGPFGVDLGLDPDAAEVKGIDTPVAGDADIILVPNLESCNIAVKMVLYYTEAFMLGAVVGGAVPVVLVSRAAPPQANLHSVALAKLLA